MYYVAEAGLLMQWPSSSHRGFANRGDFYQFPSFGANLLEWRYHTWLYPWAWRACSWGGGSL